MGAADPGPPEARSKPPPQHGRSDPPAGVPRSPVIHVPHTPHEGKGGGWTTKPKPRRPRRASSWGAGTAMRGGQRPARCQPAWPQCRQLGGNTPGGGRAAASGRRPGQPGLGARAAAAAAGWRGPEAPRSAATPTPAGGPSRYSPAGKLRAPPGLCRPPASGARKRPHIAGGWAGGARLPTSVLPCLRPLLLRRRKLVRSLGRGGTGGRAGWLTAAQRRAGSTGARFAAATAAAAAMAEPAGLRPGPGKRRLRGDGCSVPG